MTLRRPKNGHWSGAEARFGHKKRPTSRSGVQWMRVELVPLVLGGRVQTVTLEGSAPAQSARRRNTEQSPGEHANEAENAHDRLLQHDPDHQQPEAEDAESDTERDRSNAGVNVPGANRRDVVGVGVVQVSLHLVEEALLTIG